MLTRTILLILSLFISILTYAQNVGIGTASPAAQLSVGSTSQFRVNTTGNIIRINNLPYSFPAAQGTNQYLMNDGAGNLTWAAAARPVVHIFTAMPNGGFTAWQIDNATDYVSGSNLNPTLTLHKGFTYYFNVTGSIHPFFITNTPGAGSFNTGVTNNGTTNGTLIFTVPMDAPATLYYYCSVHMAMNGTIMVN